MKVILYMAMTANGYIAKENDDAPWSDEEWESYSAFAKKIGNLVIGRRTYKIMNADSAFEKLGNPFVIVVSSREESFVSDCVFVASPQEALDELKKKGFFVALVCGGSSLNASFMQENLIDEIYLDVEPMMWGKGISLFAQEPFEAKLKLIDVKKLSPDTLQLHYKIEK